MRIFLVLATVIGVLLIAAAIGIELVSTDPSMAQQLSNTRLLVWRIGENAWSFARPLLQLIAVLLILEWVFSNIGIHLKFNEISTDWNVQTFIAGIIIVTFCIAVLADIQAVGYLKDVVLIVIGFYFGTRARPSIRPGDFGLRPVVTSSPPSGPSGVDMTLTPPQGASESAVVTFSPPSGPSADDQTVLKRPQGAGESREEGRARMDRAFEDPPAG